MKSLDTMPNKETDDPSHHERIVVYVRKDDVRKLRVRLLEQIGSSNVSNWVREQIRKFLGSKP